MLLRIIANHIPVYVTSVLVRLAHVHAAAGQIQLLGGRQAIAGVGHCTVSMGPARSFSAIDIDTE